MDDCPTFFSRQFSLPPSPNVLTATQTPPLTFVDLTFDKPMDQTVVPAFASMEVIVDGVPETPIGAAWGPPQTLQLTIVGVPIVSSIFRLLVADTNLRGVDGSVVKPFQTTQAFP